MKKTLIDIKEMSDSKEVYSQRPNRAVPAFIYSLAALLIAAVLFCCFLKIDITKTATGIVRPSESVRSVTCLSSGKVLSVNCTDGQYVSVGEVLFTVDTSDAQLSLENLKKNKAELETQNEMYEKFLDGIENGKNPFSSNRDGDEYKYYIQFKNYEMSITNTQNNYDFDSKKTGEAIASYDTSIATSKDAISGLELFRESVEKDENLLINYPEYENKYLLYRSKQDSLYDEYKKQYDAAKEDPQYTEQDLIDLTDNYNRTKSQNRLQMLSDIDSSIQTAKNELASLESNLRISRLSQNMSNSGIDENGNPISVSSVSIEQATSLINAIETNKKTINEAEIQIKQLEDQVSYGTVTAVCSGIISTNSVIKSGDVISQGSVIANIIPSDECNLSVDLYVNNSDIAVIGVDDELKYNFAALPSSRYGTVNGKITDVSSDAMIQDGSYTGYYLVKSTIDRNVLTDSDGNVGNIVVGMQLEAKIVTERTTIMNYLIKKVVS